MNHTFFIYSLGCKVNSYEMEAIKNDLLNEGYQLVEEEKAEYLIINTCCVTNTAASKSRQKIHSFHQRNLNAKIIVMGCYVQGFENEVKQIPGVVLLIGTKDRHKIKEYLQSSSSQISLVEDIKEFKSYEELPLSSCLEKTRAYLKIQDGCNNYCSYCIIPYVRGTIKSRKKEEVIKEAKHLISLGYKEIVLTGIHTGSYGKDIQNFTFTMLVEELLKLDGLYRLRISSIEESEITEDFIQLLVKNEKLAKHLHIPLQAGSDDILHSMNRKYTIETYSEKVKRIQKTVPDIAITTDVIVGFPGESEENFKQTLKTCQDIGFAKIHVFPFSSRKGTLAAKMNNQINGVIKKQRANELLELSKQLNLAYNQKYIDQEVEVLIEEFTEKGYIGHTSNFIKVQIDSKKVLTRNSIVKVKIKKAYDDIVIAKLEG